MSVQNFKIPFILLQDKKSRVQEQWIKMDILRALERKLTSFWKTGWILMNNTKLCPEWFAEGHVGFRMRSWSLFVSLALWARHLIENISLHFHHLQISRKQTPSHFLYNWRFFVWHGKGQVSNVPMVWSEVATHVRNNRFCNVTTGLQADWQLQKVSQNR